MYWNDSSIVIVCAYNSKYTGACVKIAVKNLESGRASGFSPKKLVVKKSGKVMQWEKPNGRPEQLEWRWR